MVLIAVGELRKPMHSVLKAGVGIVSVNIGWVHRFRDLAVFGSEILEGGLHCGM